MPSPLEGHPPLSREEAVRLCAEVREARASRWYRFLPGQCWGCMKASNGIAEKMCMYDGTSYGGCSFVNRRYAGKR